MYYVRLNSVSQTLYIYSLFCSFWAVALCLALELRTSTMELCKHTDFHADTLRRGALKSSCQWNTFGL